MPNDASGKFQISPEMRALAEKSMEQAKTAFDGFMSAAHKTVSTLEGQAVSAQASAKDLGRKAMTLAEQNVAASFDFAQKLVRAKDMNEVMQLQAEFAKSQAKTLAEQAKNISDSVTKAAMDAAKPKQ